MALEDRLAAEPDAGHRSERQAKGVPVAKADDLRGEVVAPGGLDDHPAAHAQLAHRADHFD